jgi:hypothetical protein
MDGTMKKIILVAAIALVACEESTAPTSTSDLAARYAKPAPTPSNIAVQLLGALPYTGRDGGAAIGMALNNGTTRSATRVAGYTPYGTISEYPFTWTLASGMQPLQTIDPGYGWPSGVSDAGVIVGEMARFNSAGNRAFVVSVDGVMSYLPVPADTRNSRASGISADGACISGSFTNSAGASFAVVWRNGALDTLGTGSATGVSNDCGIASGNADGRGVVWRFNGTDWISGQLPSAGKGSLVGENTVYSETADISPNGLYVAGRRLDGRTSHAEVWRYDGAQWIATDLPGTTLYAFGVDNNGRAVGHNAKSEPTLWTRSSSGTYSAQILPSVGRSTLGWPAAINELGQVSGRSKSSDGWRAVIWTIN